MRLTSRWMCESQLMKQPGTTRDSSWKSSSSVSHACATRRCGFRGRALGCEPFTVTLRAAKVLLHCCNWCVGCAAQGRLRVQHKTQVARRSTFVCAFCLARVCSTGQGRSTSLSCGKVSPKTRLAAWRSC